SGEYLGSDGVCHGGILQDVTFDVGDVSVPADFIYGLSFNTETYGPNPTGVAGPYISLNFAVSGDGVDPFTPSVVSDLVPNTAYWNTVAANYFDGGAGGSGTFRLDANDWTGFDPAVQFSMATPEPSALSLMGAALVLGAVCTKLARRPARQS